MAGEYNIHSGCQRTNATRLVRPFASSNLLVTLTKVKRKGKEQKKVYIEKIQAACDTFANCFVFRYSNMITRPFREIQTDLAPSKYARQWRNLW